MDDKISTIKNFPQPQNVEKVRSFLGLCGYYRGYYKPFIRGFARIASPLIQLLRKEVPFHWNAPQDKKLQPWHSRTTASLFLYIQIPPS